MKVAIWLWKCFEKEILVYVFSESSNAELCFLNWMCLQNELL